MFNYMYNLTVHFSMRHMLQKRADNNGGKNYKRMQFSASDKLSLFLARLKKTWINNIMHVYVRQ